MPNIETNLKLLFDQLNTPELNSCFQAFKGPIAVRNGLDEVYNRKLAADYAKQLLKEKTSSEDDNQIFLLDENNNMKKVYLPTQLWDFMYDMITHIEKGLPQSETVRYMKRVAKLVEKSEKKSTKLYGLLEKCILKIKTEKKNSPYIAHVKELFSDDFMLEALYIYINTQILVGLHRSTKKETLKVTSFSFKLAEYLNKLYFQRLPLLSTMAKLYDVNEEPITIAEAEKETIILLSKSIIKAINNKDARTELQEVFKKMNISSLNHVKLLTRYFQRLIYHSYTHNRLNFFSVEVAKEIELNYKTGFSTKINKQYALLCTNLGAYLAAFFCNSKIFKKEFKASSWVLTTNAEIIQEAIRNPNVYMPLLHDCNKDYIKKYKDDSTIFNNLYENTNKRVHSKAYIHLDIKKECYMTKSTSTTKYSIDAEYLHQFIILMLNGCLAFIVHKTVSPFMLALYDITEIYLTNFKNALGHWVKTISIDEKEQEALVEKAYLILLNDLHTFEDSTFSDLKKLIASHDNKKNRHNYWRKYLKVEINKLCQKKLLIIGLISNAIIYSKFKYYIVETYIDGRSRRYESGTYLNTQNYHLSKMFAKLFKGSMECSRELLQHVRRRLTFKATQEQIDALLEQYPTNELLKEANNKERYQSIMDYLHKGTDIAVIGDLLSNDMDTLFIKLIPYAKDQESLLIAYSFLCHEKNRLDHKETPYLENPHELDATNSGVQCSSILFHSENLGILSNLTGRDNFDMHQNLTNKINETRELLYDIGNKAICLLSNQIDFGTLNAENKQILTEIKFKSLQTFPERYKMFYNLNIAGSTNIRDLMIALVGDLEKYNIFNDCKMIEIQELTETFLSTKHKAILNHCNYISKEIKNKIVFIGILATTMRYAFLVNKYPYFNLTNKLWQKRKIVKTMAMTSLYGSTPRGREKQVLEIIQDDYTNTIIQNKGIPNRAFKKIIHIIEKCFIYHMQRTPDTSLLHDFVHTLKQRNMPLEFTNNFFKFKFDPKKKIKSQTSGTTYFGVRGLQLVVQTDSEETNYRKLEQTSAANIIHTMDAAIVHHLTELVASINDSLKTQKHIHYRLNFTTTHDTFVSTIAIVNRILVLEAYLRLNKENYITYFPKEVHHFSKTSLEEYTKLLTPINPLFVK